MSSFLCTNLIIVLACAMAVMGKTKFCVAYLAFSNMKNNHNASNIQTRLYLITGIVNYSDRIFKGKVQGKIKKIFNENGLLLYFLNFLFNLMLDKLCIKKNSNCDSVNLWYPWKCKVKYIRLGIVLELSLFLKFLIFKINWK